MCVFHSTCGVVSQLFTYYRPVSCVSSTRKRNDKCIAVRKVIIWLSHPLTMQGSFTSELHVGISTFNGVLMLRGNVTARNESRHIYNTLQLVHASTTHYTYNLKLKLLLPLTIKVVWKKL